MYADANSLIQLLFHMFSGEENLIKNVSHSFSNLDSELIHLYSLAAVSVCLTSDVLLILEHYGLPYSASNRRSIHGYRYEDMTLADFVRLVHFW